MNYPYRSLFLIVLCSLIFQSSYAQQYTSARFVFYNVENLFDLQDDTLTADGEFTPDGEKAWTQKRYRDKIERIAKTITTIGEWEFPAMIGLCEIENRSVLNDLLDHRLLKEAGYKIIHRDSPDGRGIDVAFIYDPHVFSPLGSAWIPICFKADPEMRTRDILHVEGVLFGSDTLHVFINHWPSRWGGVEATIPKRVDVAMQLRQYTDSLFTVFGNPNILIAGDLNDNPVDSSVYKVLGAMEQYDNTRHGMYNLMFPAYRLPDMGSLKYKSDWEVYDQIIVSSALLDGNGLQVKDREAHIFNADYLLTKDERYLGEKPFRTYAGPTYLDGFSDHLPVFVDLEK